MAKNGSFRDDAGQSNVTYLSRNVLQGGSGAGNQTRGSYQAGGSGASHEATPSDVSLNQYSTSAKPMDYVGRHELDAKLETIEAKMDGRIARIEDRFISMEKTMEQIKRTLELQNKALEEQKNTPWKAAAATITLMIATIIAAVALSFSAFDSGRETATMASEAKQEVSNALTDIKKIVEDMKTPAVVGK